MHLKTVCILFGVAVASFGISVDAQCTTIAVAAANTVGLQGLASSLKLTGLDVILGNTTAYTVFAPNIAAFSALLSGAPPPTTLTDTEKTALTGLLSMHVVVGSYPAASLKDGMMLQTLVPGFNLTYALNGTFGTVRGSNTTVATIVTPDAAANLCAKSVMHEIDTVIRPDPTAGTNGTCVNLVTAVTCQDSAGCQTGRLAAAVSTLNPEVITRLNSPTQGYTVFLPSDAAATSLFNAVQNGEIASDSLTKVLYGHIVEGVYSSKDLTNGEKLTTLANTTLTIKIDGTTYMVVGPAGDSWTIIMPDYQGTAPGMICGGSLVHVINGYIALANGTTGTDSMAPPPNIGASTPLRLSAALATTLAAVYVLLAMLA